MLDEKVRADFVNLRGSLSEIYSRLGPINLPNLYWEAVDDARSARLSLTKNKFPEASEKINSTYEKIYQIHVPGDPFIHKDPLLEPRP